MSLVALASGLAANAAAGTAYWPGPTDLIRRYPWSAFAVFAVAGVVLALVQSWGPPRGDAKKGSPLLRALPAPEWAVGREEASQAAAAVRKRHRKIAGLTTCLVGAGGFGKTIVARMVCEDRRVRRFFGGRVYWYRLGRDVRSEAEIVAKVTELIRRLTGDDSKTFSDPEDAGRYLGWLLDVRPRTLLVLDDVWSQAQLDPFLCGGHKCVRLVTTRDSGLLRSSSITVGELSGEEARGVLGYKLPPLPIADEEELLRACGNWALLLHLANRLMAELIIETGCDPAKAAGEALRRRRSYWPTGADDSSDSLDLSDPAVLNQAVRASIRASTAELPLGSDERFAELGVFAEHESIPLSLVIAFWQATGGLNEFGTRHLLAKMKRLSLLELQDDDGGRISLHDVIRDYQRRELGDRKLKELNAVLVEAVAPGPAEPLVRGGSSPKLSWWNSKERYLYDHVVEHLPEATGWNDEAN